MSCPKCQGLVLPDRAQYDEWHCLNCGLRLVQRRKGTLSALNLLQPIRSSYRTFTPDQKVARNLYMRAYMKAYRRLKKRQGD